MPLSYKSELFYTVELLNSEEYETPNLYVGPDKDRALEVFKEYQFKEGDYQLSLEEYTKTWRYEGQTNPDISPSSTNIDKRYL